MSDSRRRPPGRHITKRDRGMVRFVGRTGIVTVEEVRLRFAELDEQGGRRLMARSKAYDRLAVLVANGLLRHHREVPGHGVYVATARGLAFCELGLAPARVSLGGLRHELAVARVVAGLENSFPGLRVLTEREVRRHVHLTGDESYRPKVTRRGLRDARHWPDLAIELTYDNEPWWIAVEVELTAKSAERTRAILDAYDNNNYSRPSRRLLGVVYAVPDNAQAQRIQRHGHAAAFGTYNSVGLATTVLDGPETPLAAVARLLEPWLAAREAARSAPSEPRTAAAASRTLGSLRTAN